MLFLGLHQKMGVGVLCGSLATNYFDAGSLQQIGERWRKWSEREGEYQIEQNNSRKLSNLFCEYMFHEKDLENAKKPICFTYFCMILWLCLGMSIGLAIMNCSWLTAHGHDLEMASGAGTETLENPGRPEPQDQAPLVLAMSQWGSSQENHRKSIRNHMTKYRNEYGHFGAK